MVLYKRKPVQPLPPPDIDDDHEQVWQISETGEAFIVKDDYTARMDFYKNKQFSCEITGHMNLTFFEALASEAQHAQDVEQAFPEPLKEPVLRRVQFSTVSRIDTLVDQLHEGFKNDFYPGEHVTAILPAGDRVDALVREKTMFPELRYPSGEVQRKGFSRYTVKLVNRNDEEAQIDNEHLVRDKKTFTKAMLRSFIKNTVSREPWNGAPWLVKEEFAIRYKIPQNVPPHLQKAHNAAERKAQAQARRRQESQALSVGALAGNQESASPPPTNGPVDIRPAPKSHKSKTQQAIKFSKIYQLEDGKGSPTSGGSPWPSSPGGTPDGSGPKTNQKIMIKPSPPAAPPKPLKYPIEDLDLPSQADTRRPKLHWLTSVEPPKDETTPKEEPQSNENGSSSRRVSRSSTQNALAMSVPGNTNAIDQSKVAFYLSTWVFLNIYCQPFKLDSFTFDDYMQALEFSNEEVDCELFVEIHCTLLKAIVDEQQGLIANLPDVKHLRSDEETEQTPPGSENDFAEISENPEHAADDKEDEEMNDAPADGGFPGKHKKHRAHEMFDEGDSWIQRAKVRDFKNGGWQAIIVGFLYQLSFDDRYSRDTEDILAHLVPIEEKPTPDAVMSRYVTMNTNLRVIVVHLLSSIVHETKVVREYIEECSEAMTELRKDKIEVQRARKNLLEELKSLDDERKILLPENTPKSPSPDPETRQPSTDADGDSRMNGIGEDVDEEDEDEDDVVRARALRRGGERANERKRKREEEKVQAIVAAKAPKTSKQFQKILKAIETTKTHIKKKEEQIATHDEDLRQADCSRFRMMGTDRFWNKYWWFERNGMPFGGIPTSSTADAGYANAMIWVQGPEESEKQGFLVEEAGTALPRDRDGDVKMNGHGKGRLTVLERRAREENGTTVDSPTEYGYLETVGEFNALMSWLDVKGIREKKLKKEFEAFRKHIEDGMQNRERYLAQSIAAQAEKEANGGRTTRGRTYFDNSVWRCLNWRNDAAMSELGHLHYEEPQKKKNTKKNSSKKNDGNVPLNRQGKPVSRQGERYSF